MACNDCGECRYSDASTADLSIVITSGGFAPACKPDKSSVFNGLPVVSAGAWAVSYSTTMTVTVHSSCLSGAWTWSVTGGTGGGGGSGGPPPGCDEPVEDHTVVSVLQDGCDGYHRITLIVYTDGRWKQEEVTIQIQNNAECI